MIQNGCRRLAERLGEDLGHVGNPPGITAKVVAVERVVEHVCRIEARIAENALRVDRQPAARSQHDVVVMQVAMQRQHVDWIGQQPFRSRSRFDVEALFAGVAIDPRLVEQRLENRTRSG